MKRIRKQHACIRYKPLGLTFLLILTCLLVFNPQTRIHTVEVYAMTPQEDAEYFRGPNYETLSYPNGTTLWESASQYVWNGSAYVPYIINNTYTSNGYITIQAGLIGAELHKGKIVYYDPNMTTLAVGRENWVVFEKVDDNWKPVCASLEKYFDSMILTEKSEYVNVTATWTTPKGNLTIAYHFEENLKHTVTFDPIDNGQYAVAQIWNNTQYEKVRLTNAMIIKKNDNVVVGKTDALTVLFHNDTQPFGIMEDQTLAEDKLKYVIFAGGTVNYQGFSITDAVAWIFGTWTLNSNETLTIDPITSTFYSSASDGQIGASSWTETSGTVGDSYAGAWIGRYDSTYYRSFVFFDTSSITDYGTIISATLSLRGYYGKTADGDMIVVQNGQPTYPHDPLESGDFNSAYYSGHGGNISITSWSTSGYNDITFNADGRSWINKTGTTKPCLRTQKDIDGDSTTTNVRFYCYETASGRPKLSITYSVPETTVYSSSKDGIVFASGSNWDTLHDATSGTVDDSDNCEFYAMNGGLDDPIYKISRGFFYFDTSFLGDAEILSVDLKIHGYGDAYTSVSAMKGTQHDTLIADDFDAFEGSEYGYVAWIYTTYNTISFNAQGISDINGTGITKICCRERTSDYLDSTPPAERFNGAYFSEESGTSKDPKLVVGYIPSLSMGEFEAPSMVHPQQPVFINATINRDGGVANFENATIELNGTIILKWINSTNTFSEESDPNNCCTLNASASIRTTVNSTAYKLSWSIQLAWNYTEGSISILASNTKVYDSQGVNASGSHADLFTFEDDLIMYSTSVDPTEAYTDALVTFEGTLCWEGTSTPPSNTTGMTVKIEWNDTEKGSTSSINASGQWSRILQAPSIPYTYSYNVYAVHNGVCTTQNQTVELIVMKRPSEGGPVGPYEPTPPVERPDDYVYEPPEYFGPEPITAPDWGLPAIAFAIIGLGIIGYVSQKLRREESRAKLVKRRTKLKRGNQRRDYAKRTKTKR